MFGAAEGRLGMDVPVLFAELRDQLLECREIAEGSGRASEVKQALEVNKWLSPDRNFTTEP